MKCKCKSNFIQENKGAVTLTVIVAFMFLSILVVTILSLVVMNFRMKTMDRQAKDEFYYVEKSLNDIYAGVGKECAKELGTVYSSTLSSSYEFTDDTMAYEEFHVKYVKRLVELFYTQGSSRVNLKDKLNKYLTADAKSSATVNNKVDASDENTYIKIVFVKKDGTEDNTPNSANYKDYSEIIFKDIYVSSVDSSSYKSSITTDINIKIPEVSLLKINEDELDYALVGCRGLVFNGSADIKGNVYGGVDKRNASDPSYYTGGISVSKLGATTPEVTLNSNYVISAGDITVNDGTLKITNGYTTNDNEIWTENTIIGSKDETADKDATVEIGGNTYALNDLQIEGKNKTVTFTGNYYGYGDGENSSLSPKETNTKKQEAGNSYYDDVTRSKSSSIIVNAKDSSINLKGLDNLVILGQAYIDHNSKYVTGNDNTPQVNNPTDAKLSKDETGMAGTIKASQEILLVPEEFLDLSNPIQITSTTTDFTVKTTELNNWINTNFHGRVKLKNGAPTRTVKFKKGSMNYAYCYFQFDNTNSGDEEKYRSAYIDEILNCNLSDTPSTIEPSLQTLKRRILAAAESQNSQIMTDDSKNVYAKNGGVISFEYEDQSDPNTPFKENNIKFVNGNTDNAGYSGMVENANKKYRNLYTYLDFNSDFKRVVAADDFNNADYPYGRLWWIKGINNDTSGGTVKQDFENYRVIVQGNNTLNLGSYLNNNAMTSNQKVGDFLKLIVISNGDVVIDSDVKIKGFIFSNGKVIVNDGKKLEIESDLSLVQKIINEELTDIKSNMPEAADNNQINATYKSGYITRYLLRTEFDNNNGKLKAFYNNDSTTVIGNRRYNIYTKQTTDASKLINTDYTSFVRLDNWRKTGAGGN